MNLERDIWERVFVWATECERKYILCDPNIIHAIDNDEYSKWAHSGIRTRSIDNEAKSKLNYMRTLTTLRKRIPKNDPCVKIKDDLSYPQSPEWMEENCKSLFKAIKMKNQMGLE